MTLVKIQPGDITSDSPIPFPIYTADGRLLLQEGQRVTTSSLLDRVYDLGYRSSAAKGQDGLLKRAPDSQEGNTGLLIGSVPSADKTPVSPEPVEVSSSITLPSLSRQVEFFRLTRAGTSEIIPVELIGIIHQKAIIVKNETPNAEIDLNPQHDYDAKLFIGCNLSSFSTRLAQGGVGPFGCFYLTYPENLALRTVRRYRRVVTSFPAKLQSGEYQRASVDTTVCNISLTGAGVLSDIDFLTVGQYARMSMDLMVGHRVRPVEIYVEVKNRREKDGDFFYGLEFARVSDEVRQDIKDFVLENLLTL